MMRTTCGNFCTMWYTERYIGEVYFTIGIVIEGCNRLQNFVFERVTQIDTSVFNPFLLITWNWWWVKKWSFLSFEGYWGAEGFKSVWFEQMIHHFNGQVELMMELNRTSAWLMMPRVVHLSKCNTIQPAITCAKLTFWVHFLFLSHNASKSKYLVWYS